MHQYQLREAAGCYWLLDMEQEPFRYKKPLRLNGTGAEMFRLLQKGFSKDEAAEALAEQFHAKTDEVLVDLQQFCRQLEENGFYL